MNDCYGESRSKETTRAYSWFYLTLFFRSSSHVNERNVWVRFFPLAYFIRVHWFWQIAWGLHVLCSSQCAEELISWTSQQCQVCQSSAPVEFALGKLRTAGAAVLCFLVWWLGQMCRICWRRRHADSLRLKVHFSTTQWHGHNSYILGSVDILTIRQWMCTQTV